MPNINKNNGFNGKIKVRNGNSGLSEFVKRPLPTDDEIEEFEEAVHEEAREGEIDESLSEIYQDEKGDIVDVMKLNIKKKRGFFFKMLNLIFLLAIFAGLGYGFYYYIFRGGSDATALDLSVSAPEKVIAGEEFFCTLTYKNLSRANANQVRVEVTYPDNFIFLDSQPKASEKDSVWKFDTLATGESGEIKIKGKIVNQKETSNVLLAKITYTPENFSSEFKKEASHTFSVEDIGLDINFDYSSSVLVGQESEIAVKVRLKENNFLPQFKLTVDPLENMEIISVAAVEAKENKADQNLKIEKVRPGVYNVSEIGKEEQEFKIKYKLSKKIADEQEIIMRFENLAEDDKTRSFLEKKIKIEVMKSDLNLTLIINGSKNDQAVNFGDRLNYSLVYNNKGETSMKDVVLMAVLESDFLNWKTLKEENNGQERGNSLTWTKEEIPALAELEPNKERVIDFSVDIVSLEEATAKASRSFQIKSYVQFSIGNSEEFKENLDNRSNTIINKINSDLSLKEEVRYFSADNVPVGNGPLPPKVGETTSFKVYWTLANNLHELNDAKVEVSLPEDVNWDNKNRASVGVVSYDSDSRKVTWQIGRLPITVYRADAEFNISITPADSDKNRIMVLLPEARVTAVDNETQGNITATAKAKTTKLEDDDIAGMSSDGRVE
ncbi:MAG: hypothetical protein PHZ04_05135 [Patescibacteria group bacterium]|nr:hypothetical protein [Patescibacteria group bacterium]MDD5294824.1 hypothetical protein [Patescibacteria group bacterium]MDD5554179.1 hypothetical protein [Patescibacteria group bacterium]